MRRGCPSQKTIEALQDRVITSPVVDKFEELLAAKQSPLCLFATRKACQEFNLEMLSRLQADTKEISCVDEVDETTGTFKWNKKATDETKKLNSDCNLTAGLEAVLQVAIGARVMLRRNIDTAVGLVNGAVGTVMSIRTLHITVQFDGMHEPHHIERVKSRFMVLKKIYVQRKQFPLILAFAVTVHKCQGLSQLVLVLFVHFPYILSFFIGETLSFIQDFDMEQGRLLFGTPCEGAVYLNT